MLFSVVSEHSSSFIHKPISIFSGFKYPNTNCVFAVIDGFQLIIYIANLLRYICFDTNHSIPTLLKIAPLHSRNLTTYSSLGQRYHKKYHSPKVLMDFLKESRLAGCPRSREVCQASTSSTGLPVSARGEPSELGSSRGGYLRSGHAHEILVRLVEVRDSASKTSRSNGVGGPPRRGKAVTARIVPSALRRIPFSRYRGPGKRTYEY